MLPRHAHRLFLLALGLSLLLHLSLVASPTAWWLALQPADEIPLPIEAALYTPPPPPPPPRTAKPRPAPAVPPAPHPPADEPPLPPPPSAPEALSEPVPEPAPVPVSIPAAEPPPVPLAEAYRASEPAQPPTPPPPARPLQRQLPESLTLDYAVAMGSISVGQARFIWSQRDGRYSLVSTTEASGLVSLFVSGRIIQTSEGEIAPDGLRPAQYWLQRGKGRQAHARFDWRRQRLTLNDRGTALPDTAQDLLGFPFHLALTARPGEPEFDLPVTDGNKLRIYRVRYLGEEVLDGHATWRYQATRFDDGSLDVWLDPGLGGLPRKIRTLDAKGKVMALQMTD